MDTQNNLPSTGQDEQKKALDKRLDQVGWALFLIMIGCLWLVPRFMVPQGAWLIGTGIIILGLTWVRHINDIIINKFWVVCGIVALVAGLSQFLGIKLPLFPILLVIVGVSIIVKPMMKSV
jgi:hypothetical protein